MSTDRCLPVPFVLNEGGGPDRCHFICGYFGCDLRPFNPLLAKLAELMFVEVLRKTCISDLPEDARGWCSAIRDPQVGAALHLIHDRPAQAWTVDTLAREVGMSRSTFAERFTSFAGRAADALPCALAPAARGESSHQSGHQYPVGCG